MIIALSFFNMRRRIFDIESDSRYKHKNRKCESIIMFENLNYFVLNIDYSKNFDVNIMMRIFQIVEIIDNFCELFVKIKIKNNQSTNDLM